MSEPMSSVEQYAATSTNCDWVRVTPLALGGVHVTFTPRLGITIPEGCEAGTAEIVAAIREVLDRVKR